jgi:hypothetical protein
MKKVFIATLVLPFFAFTCDKAAKDTWLQGKVVRISCASFVVQLLNNDTLGEDGWKDMTNNDAVYDNVFTANNKCSIPDDIKAGATIRFKLDQPTKSDCVLCMMYDGPPKVKFDVKELTVVESAK